MMSVVASPSMLKRRSTGMDVMPPTSAPRKRQRTMQYECDWTDCEAAFHSAARLEEHRRSHTGEKPFKCTHPGCTSAFSRSHHLSAHQRVHASSSSSTPRTAEAGTSSAPASPAPNERPYTCAAQACTASFTEGWRRKRHEETCDVLRAECGLLGQETEAEATAIESEGAVDGEGAGTASGETRKRKRGGHHERADRLYACSEAQCDASFRKRKHLRAHVWAAHSAQPELSPFVRSAAGTPNPGASASVSTTADVGVATASASTSALPMAAPTTATAAIAKPFPCTHEGCTRSFTTAALRRTHARKHTTQRYVCTFPHASGGSASFPTWSALQLHMKQAHPPTCEQCGKTFKRNENLRAHMVRHEERAAAEQAAMRSALKKRGDEEEEGVDEEEQGIDVEGQTSMDEEQQAKLEGRTFICNWSAINNEEGAEGACTKRFKSAYARDTHVKVAHKKERNHRCCCGKAYGHKHLLRAHLRKAGEGHADAREVRPAVVQGNPSRADGTASDGEEESGVASPAPEFDAASDSDDFYRAEGGAVPESHASRPAAPRRRRNAKPNASLAALLTGAGYAASSSDRSIAQEPSAGDAETAAVTASKRRVRGRVLGCPWGKICELRDAQPTSSEHAFDIDDEDEDEGEGAAAGGTTKTRCDYRFSRLYDVRRHLGSAHDLQLSDAEIKALLPLAETRALPKPRRSATPAART